MTPAIATVGIAASGTIGMFENLPGYLEIDELSEKSNIYATGSDGSPVLLASFYDQNRVEVGWDAISQYVKDAAIAGEDPRFYEHGGIDLQGTRARGGDDRDRRARRRAAPRSRSST